IQLTTSGNAVMPAISPDGKYVAYVQQDGDTHSLWVRQVATASNVKIVEHEPGVVLLGPTVTPDGNFVDFLRSRGAGVRAELWRVSVFGGAAKGGLGAAWVPRGGWSARQPMGVVPDDVAAASESRGVAATRRRHRRAPS